MHIVYTDSPDSPAAKLYITIKNHLSQGQNVLWLISGGSTIGVAVEVMRRLAAHPKLNKLTIMQVDERYGPVDHPASNWGALRKAGFADTTSARCIPVLQNLPLEQTISAYNKALARAMEDATLKIGLFGIGADGHTAGILPHSQAARQTDNLVTGYKGPDYTRVTITTAAMARLDLAVAFAMGRAKFPALQKLRTDVPVAEQPAQALKRAGSFYVYTDYQAGGNNE